MFDELNILREVGSIAAAQGSKALSEILSRPITLNMPSTDIVSSLNITRKVKVDTMAIGVISRLLVGLPGEIALILDEKAAFKLISLSYRLTEKEKSSGVYTEVGISLLKEIGNIILVTYVMALGSMMKRNIFTSLPTFISGSLENIMNAFFAPYSEEKRIFVIEAVFEEPREKIKGGFCLALTEAAANDIRQVCKKMLEELEK